MSAPLPMADRARRVRNPYWVRAPVATAALAGLLSLGAHSAGLYFGAPALTSVGLGDGAATTPVVLSTIRRAPDRYVAPPTALSGDSDSAPADATSLADAALAAGPDLPATEAPAELALREFTAEPDPLLGAEAPVDVMDALGDDPWFDGPDAASLEIATPVASNGSVGVGSATGAGSGIGAAGLADAALAATAVGTSSTVGGAPGGSVLGEGPASAAAPGAGGLDLDTLTSLGMGGSATRSNRPGGPAAIDPLAALPELAGFDAVEMAGLDLPLSLDRDFAYRVERVDPQRAAEPGYFRVGVRAEPSLRSKLEVLPKDVVFVVDTSGSIPEHTVQACVAGVAEALATLNPGDRFNIVLFNDAVRFYDGSALLVEATPDRIAQATVFLRNAEPAGYTALGAAVRQLLVPRPEPGRVYNLIFISDGVPTRGVLDTRELINTVTADNGLGASIYCVGVWGARRQRPNRELLDFLAYRNNGFSVIAERGDDPAALIRDLAGTLRYPLIQQVEVRTAGAALEGGSVYPRRLPTIHRGQTFEVFGRFNRPGRVTLTLTGRSAGPKVDFTFAGDLRLADPGDPAVLPVDWARRKLHDLYDDYLSLGRPEALRLELRRLGEAYGIKTLY
ncbi:MAG: VWA domain-containing protein [Planctomycetota bacterium]